MALWPSHRRAPGRQRLDRVRVVARPTHPEGRLDVSDQDAPRTDRRLQDEQDPDAPETRRDEEEGTETTPMGQTDGEHDEAGSAPGD